MSIFGGPVLPDAYVAWNRKDGQSMYSLRITAEVETNRLSAHVDQCASLTDLRRRWWRVAFLYALSVACGYALLCNDWTHTSAWRWALVATCVLVYELWLLWRKLPDNRRQGEQVLLPTLGLGNILTLLRGLAIGLLAGFLFSPWPPGEFVWAPGFLYTLAVVSDYLDGYVSRLTHHVTELGKTLDIEFDALGILIAVALAVQYGQLPSWYLVLGLARYGFVVGIWWSERHGKPVYALPPSVRRRVIGGCQAGFVSVVLWPFFAPPSTTVAGVLFALPVAASFVQDWFVVRGRVDPAARPYRKAKRKVATLTTKSYS